MSSSEASTPTFMYGGSTSLDAAQVGYICKSKMVKSFFCVVLSTSQELAPLRANSRQIGKWGLKAATSKIDIKATVHQHEAPCLPIIASDRQICRGLGTPAVPSVGPHSRVSELNFWKPAISFPIAFLETIQVVNLQSLPLDLTSAH